MILQAALGVWLILSTGDWFGMANVWHVGPTALMVYLAASAAAGAFFYFTEFSRKDEPQNLEVG